MNYPVPAQSKYQKLKDFAQTKTAKWGVATGAVMATIPAYANGPSVPDMTPIVTMINGLVAVVASVGMAVLTVYATAKVFKWVKGAF